MGKIEKEYEKKLREYLEKEGVKFKQHSKRNKDVRPKPQADK